MDLLFNFIYMTAVTTKDEDLIILDSDTSDIFDFWAVETKTETQDSSEPELVIDFWSSDTDVKTEKPQKVEDTKLDDSFAFDFDLWTSETITEEPVLTEAKSEDTSFELFSTENVTEEVVQAEDTSSKTDDFFASTSQLETTSVDESIWDISSILDQTIQKLKSRKEIISTQRSDKSTQVNNLQEQIKKLQSQVEGLNEDIEDLDTESKKIDKNISSIEKMKSDDSSEIADRRQHNLGNIKKAK